MEASDAFTTNYELQSQTLGDPLLWQDFWLWQSKQRSRLTIPSKMHF